MKSLTEIFAEGNSDRLPLHDYPPVYDQLFTPIRLKPIRLLEIGFLSGDGLEAWARYFPSGEIHGLDIMDWLYRPTNPHIQLHYGDASKKEVLDQLPVSFDVVIDDGPHTSAQQMDTFTIMWPRVNPGGFYCIEDLHSVHAPELCDHPLNIIQYLSKLAIDMQDPAGAKGSARYNPEHRWSELESITLRKGLAILRKRS